MCLRIAENYEFRLVPQYLVGYRMTSVNMSSDVMQMLRSCEIVLAEFREKYPSFASDFDAHLFDMIRWLAIRALIEGQFFAASELLRRLFATEPGVAICGLPNMLEEYCKARLVPRWLKMFVRRMRNDKGEFRPLYSEMGW